jgi:hypothetical protein
VLGKSADRSHDGEYDFRFTDRQMRAYRPVLLPWNERTWELA